MKQGIHPDYHPVVFEDSSTGYKFLSGSTGYHDLKKYATSNQFLLKNRPQ